MGIPAGLKAIDVMVLFRAPGTAHEHQSAQIDYLFRKADEDVATTPEALIAKMDEAGIEKCILETATTNPEDFSKDNRERMFGEDRLWRYKLGATLVALGRYAAADEQLRAALAATGREWTAGRIHTELGKVADAAGRRRDAVAAYSQAIDLGRRDSDPVGVNEARRLKREPYRTR